MNPVLDIAALRVELRAGRSTGLLLDDITLQLAPGRVLGLIGESGSGKSTLLNAVLGILPAQALVAAGRITVDGPTAYVPQDPATALDPLFTIGTQIDDVLRARRPELPRTGRHDCAVAQLAAVQLADPARLLRRHPHELSGGQRQRLMLAIALMTEPALLIADEPTTALDLLVQAEILELIAQLLARRSVAMVIATHDPGVAWEICDELAVMYGGTIVEAGAAAEVLTQPRHPYTRRLLAASGAGRRGTAIPGSVPGPFERLPGCRFEPRCPERQAQCLTAAPAPVLQAERRLRCWCAVT